MGIESQPDFVKVLVIWGRVFDLCNAVISDLELKISVT